MRDDAFLQTEKRKMKEQPLVSVVLDFGPPDPAAVQKATAYFRELEHARQTCATRQDLQAEYDRIWREFNSPEYATARNTPAVRKGYEMGGYVKAKPGLWGEPPQWNPQPPKPPKVQW
jgi:hypothetical protein